MNRIKRRLLGLAVFGSLACVLCLFVIWWPIQGPWETRVDYYMRRLKTIDNHVGMPEGSEQWIHGITSAGSDGMEVLVREIVVGSGFGTRFTPSPEEMLARFGEAGRMRLHSEYFRIKSQMLLSSDACVQEMGSLTFVVVALVESFSDVSLLVDWAETMSSGQRVVNGLSIPDVVQRRALINRSNFAVNRLNDVISSKWGDSYFPTCCGGEMTTAEMEALKQWVREISADNARPSN